MLLNGLDQLQQVIEAQRWFTSGNSQFDCVWRHQRDSFKPLVDEKLVIDVSGRLRAHETFAIATLGHQHGIEARVLAVDNGNFSIRANPKNIACLDVTDV